MVSAPELLKRAAHAPWMSPARAVASLLPEGRETTSGFGAAVRPLFHGSWPDRALWIIAVRLDVGRRVVFGRDPLSEIEVGTAVEASCAVPGRFAPVTIDGHRYVDGGVHSPTHADLLCDSELDIAIVIAPLAPRLGQHEARSASRRWALATLLLTREARRLARRGVTVYRWQPSGEEMRAMAAARDDLGGLGAVLHHAYESARERLETENLEPLRRELAKTA
jgi:NTE family protein